jgi:hypothetical protein
MKRLERWRTGASPGGKNDSKESSRRLALPKTHYLEKRADGQIRQFAGIVQAPETSGKVSSRHGTAEVRGSNPLGATVERAPEGHCSQVKLLAAVEAERNSTRILRTSALWKLASSNLPHRDFSIASCSSIEL